MKILFLAKSPPNPKESSGSIIVLNRMRFLADRGYQVGLLAFQGDGGDPADLPSGLLDRVLLPPPEPPGRLRRRLGPLLSGTPSPFYELRNDRMARTLGTLIEQSHYDVLIAEHSVMGQFLYRNPYLPAIRRIVSCHECYTTAYRKAIRIHRWSARGLVERLLFRKLCRYEFAVYRAADHIMVLTPQERYGLLRYAPNLRITVVPHGVDLRYFTPADPAKTDEAILFIGHFSLESNRDAVIWFTHSVWPKLKTLHPNLKFFIVGRGVTHAIRDLGRRDARILVTGEVPDIRPYLAKARVFVCPVRMGSGFRAKLLEAMASGVPVVSTSLGAEGIPGRIGTDFFLADTPRQLVRHIHLLLSDAGLRKTMAANGRELMVSRFSSTYGKDSLEQVLQETVEGYDY